MVRSFLPRSSKPLAARASLLAGLALLPAATATLHAAAFTSGDIVIYTDNGTSTLSSAATPVQLEEFNPLTGTVVQTIGVSSTGSSALTASGTAASDGEINLSGDGSLLTFSGYNAPAGTTGVTSNTNYQNRLFAVADSGGTVNYSSPYAATGANARAVVSAGAGSGYYVATSSGLGYTPTLTFSGTTVSAVTGAVSFRGLSLASNGGSFQLYGSASSAANNGGVNTIGGPGLPPAGTQAVTTLLPGFTTTNASQNQFTFLSLGGNGNVDTLYLALGQTGGGIQRFNLVNGVWTLAYTLNPSTATGFFGLTARVNPLLPTQVQLFATTEPSSSNTGANQLYAITDSATAGSTSAAGDTYALLATAGTNQEFRGVSFAPTALTVPEPSTWALLIAGLAGLLAIVRRRRRDTVRAAA